MDTQIIVVFCLCADMLKSLHHYEDRQCRMSDDEVITTAIIAMLYFKGNFLSGRSVFVRTPLHSKHVEQQALQSQVTSDRRPVLTLFLHLGETWKKLNENAYIKAHPMPDYPTEPGFEGWAARPASI